MRKLILLSAALLASTPLMPATAQAPAGRAVSYRDLDLDSPAGRAALDRRIATALESVCGSYAGAPSYQAHVIDRCRAAARSGIETQLAALRPRAARLAFGPR